MSLKQKGQLSKENFVRAYVQKQIGIFNKQVGERFVLYDPLSQVFLRLNKPANDIWGTATDTDRRSVASLVTECAEIYDLEESDVLEALIDFAKQGFLVVVS